MQRCSAVLQSTGSVAKLCYHHTHWLEEKTDLDLSLTPAPRYRSINEQALNNASDAWPLTGAFVKHSLCPPEEIPPKMMTEGAFKAGKEGVVVHLQVGVFVCVGVCACIHTCAHIVLSRKQSGARLLWIRQTSSTDLYICIK